MINNTAFLKAMAIPDKIIELLRANDRDALRRVLLKVQVANQNDELFFVQQLLMYSYRLKSDECIEAILDYYAELDEVKNLDRAKYTMNVRLIESHILNEDVLIYVFSLSNETFEEACLDIMSADMGPNITPIIMRASHILSPDYAAIRAMRELAIEKANYMAKGTFQQLARRVSPWSPKPMYMQSETSKTTGKLVAESLKDLTLEVLPTPDDTESLRVVLRRKVEQTLGIKFTQDPEGKKQYSAMVSALESTSGPKERAELHQFTKLGSIPTVSSLSMGDIESGTRLFRVLGPLNLSRGSGPDISGKCGKYGCRMMTCVCYPNNDEEFESDEEFGFDQGHREDSTEWFTGACWACDSRIPRACYALRRPMANGGWRGTYCSVSCVQNDDVDDPLNLVEQAMLRIIYEQLSGIGLIDREDDDVHPFADKEESGLLESDEEEIN